MIPSIIQYSTGAIDFLLVNSLYSLLLAAIVILIRLLYSKLNQRLEYGLWCLVLVRLILPNDLSFEYALSAVVGEWLWAFQPSEFSRIILNDVGLAISAERLVLSDIRLSAIDMLGIVWMSIITLVFIRYLGLRLRLVRMLNLSRPIVEYSVLTCVNRWRLNFWVKQSVHVIAEDRYLSPFTCYWKTPIIYIPLKIIQTHNASLIESIIAHEMAHVKRRDALWLMLQNIIQIIYFFNPLVWLIVRRMSALRENICDEMVLSANSLQPNEYGNSLLSVLRFNLSGEIKGTLINAFLGYKREIKRRISNIANFVPKKNHRYSNMALLIVFAVFFLPCSQTVPSVFQTVYSQPVNQSLESSPFPKDVAIQVILPVLTHRKK